MVIRLDIYYLKSTCPGTFGIVDYTNYDDMKYAVSFSKKHIFSEVLHYFILIVDVFLLFRYENLMILNSEILGREHTFGYLNLYSHAILVISK